MYSCIPKIASRGRYATPTFHLFTRNLFLKQKIFYTIMTKKIILVSENIHRWTWTGQRSEMTHTLFLFSTKISGLVDDQVNLSTPFPCLNYIWQGMSIFDITTLAQNISNYMEVTLWQLVNCWIHLWGHGFTWILKMPIILVISIFLAGLLLSMFIFIGVPSLIM